jgi:hypothetical protein
MGHEKVHLCGADRAGALYAGGGSVWDSAGDVHIPLLAEAAVLLVSIAAAMDSISKGSSEDVVVVRQPLKPSDVVTTLGRVQT